MQHKFVRYIMLLLQMAMFILCAATCADGVSRCSEFIQMLPYFESLLRVICLLFFSVLYYKVFVFNSSSANIFMICLNFAAFINELKILSTFIQMTGLSAVPPVVSEYLFIFSLSLMCLSLLGYVIYYQNNEYGPASRFIVLSIIASLALAYLMPMGQSIESLYSAKVFFNTMTFLHIACLAGFVILVSEHPGPGTGRNIFSMILLVGIYLTNCFQGANVNIAGTLLFCVGLVSILAFSMRNSVRL